MDVTATIVETKDLVLTVAAALIASGVVTASFSVLIFASARFSELRRNDRPLLATAAGTLAAVALLTTAAAIALGIVEMSSKD